MSPAPSVVYFLLLAGDSPDQLLNGARGISSVAMMLLVQLTVSLLAPKILKNRRILCLWLFDDWSSSVLMLLIIPVTLANSQFHNSYFKLSRACATPVIWNSCCLSSDGFNTTHDTSHLKKQATCNEQGPELAIYFNL